MRHAHALALLLRGEFDLAESELAVARQHDALHMGLRAHQALLLLLYRQVSTRHAGLSIGPAGEVLALAALGRSGEARLALAALQAAWVGRYLPPYQLAMAELRLGCTDAALALLERAVHERDPNALCLPVDPAFDCLHGQPRFDALVQRVRRRAVERSAATPPDAAG